MGFGRQGLLAQREAYPSWYGTDVISMHASGDGHSIIRVCERGPNVQTAYNSRYGTQSPTPSSRTRGVQGQLWPTETYLPEGFQCSNQVRHVILGSLAFAASWPAA